MSTSLAFGRAGASIIVWAPPQLATPAGLRDWNDNRFMGLLVHFDVDASGLGTGDTEACVTGEMLDGTPIEGCDSIVTVGSCGIGFELVLVVPALMWLYRRRFAEWRSCVSLTLRSTRWRPAKDVVAPPTPKGSWRVKTPPTDPPFGWSRD